MVFLVTVKVSITLVEQYDMALLQNIMAVHREETFKESIQQAHTMMQRVNKKGVLQVTYEQTNYKSFDPDGKFKGCLLQARPLLCQTWRIYAGDEARDSQYSCLWDLP